MADPSLQVAPPHVSVWQQVRRVGAEVCVLIGAVGTAITLYAPDLLRLAPNVKWLPAALAILGFAVKVLQKTKATIATADKAGEDGG